ncbi:amino acid ABC transporter permease [Sinorhizobium meliloti]|jgi:glutamate/aspartate transport system permease protein|uniref:amino acid ABC transporter permease n=1 Tax=Rhizobium meliloti TaxID=382 RepID=UPI0002861A55|nr:amino acid ABC transporter permease [Sinorhizobium meliloti]ASP80103.1 amino acid ABC transporter permease [Sinorhizobium meliloti]MCM5688728.1 amino acid ABC transporter permease [Sinorhizobium meliloti]MDE3799458.1 amino acid ABC transporter permease [Sinorhizobium meliloti]MDE4605777.1 amino acid ABC transporter permease [Sinorhizobium meliloti]MQW15746.1 ABC transporter permease subunit [Sinorhizobium meliloti]
MSGFDFSVIADSLPSLSGGLAMSFMLTAMAMAGGLILGLILAIVRLSNIRFVSIIAALYVNGFRAVPLILVIFWFYFLVPLVIGRPVGALYSVIIAFIMFEGAYYSEILRAGMQSVRHGQWQAAKASGLSFLQTVRLVVLPQALRKMAPLMVTQGVILFQDTSLVYVVSLHDFMTSASIVANTQNRIVEMYVFAAAVYFILCTLGSTLAERLKRNPTLA